MGVGKLPYMELPLETLLSHSRSFKVIPDYTDEYGVCEVLLVIHCRQKY